MAKSAEKIQAEQLRRHGWSIKQIATQLRVSRSSASNWCRDIALTTAQRAELERRQREGGNRGRILGSQTNHDKKMERIAHHVEEGKLYLKQVTERELLTTGLGIYWGEGTKKGRLGFINSDPEMILFMYQWFLLLGVSKEEFILRVLINDLHRPRDVVIRKFWSKLLGIPLSQFRTTTFIHRENTKRYSNHDDYFGLLMITVRKSTELKYKILGLIEGLKYSKLDSLPA